ncbi:ssDNA binding protein [Arthrobacter phage Sarge]|uniref:Single-stranded DNA-binding protein n=1 Tax=Arthrobacter phage Sarge TaxID=2885974 RepID=A0AAE8Y5G1_9CAUD|nr:ssDNA binding protein [Arthrobacter phage Sarge]UDL14896.1 ssDNA binding protein [Arthrobacter phage Sarge]
MSNETNLTIRGRLTADPELRFTPSGAAVVNFTIAAQASKFDKNSNEWKDQPAKFWRCAAWNQGKLTRAENIANMLKKGDSVIVYGELTTREYETKEGEKRTADEIRVESIGKDLTFHGQPYAANEQNTRGQQTAQSDPWATPATPPTQSDPWATPATSNSGGGWGNGPDGQPPF